MNTIQKIIFYLIIVISVGIIIFAYHYYNGINKKLQGLQKENQKLAMQKDSLEGIVIVDSTTIRKKATEVDNLSALLKNDKDILGNLKKNGFTLDSYIRILSKNRIDNIRLKADTVFKVITVDKKDTSKKYITEFGSVKVDSLWYYIDVDWSCNPYLLNVNRLVTYEKLALVEYKNKYGSGVYVKDYNPHSVVDSLNYFVPFKDTQQNNFRLGVGGLVGYRDKLRIFPTVNAGLDRHNVSFDWDMVKFLDDKKLSVDQFRIGYTYDIIK